jgi:hypothetical protein
MKRNEILQSILYALYDTGLMNTPSPMGYTDPPTLLDAEIILSKIEALGILLPESSSINCIVNKHDKVKKEEDSSGINEDNELSTRLLEEADKNTTNLVIKLNEATALLEKLNNKYDILKLDNQILLKKQTHAGSKELDESKLEKEKSINNQTDDFPEQWRNNKNLKWWLKNQSNGGILVSPDDLFIHETQTVEFARQYNEKELEDLRVENNILKTRIEEANKVVQWAAKTLLEMFPKG